MQAEAHLRNRAGAGAVLRARGGAGRWLCNAAWAAGAGDRLGRRPAQRSGAGCRQRGGGLAPTFAAGPPQGAGLQRAKEGGFRV